MEAGDVIYGVTMEEAGVSKLLSMKMSEAEEAVSVSGV
jgi:chromosome segregation ATPase